jgi:hypothetical protein
MINSVRAEQQRSHSTMLERGSNKSVFYQEDFLFVTEKVLKLADKIANRLHKIVVDGTYSRKTLNDYRSL